MKLGELFTAETIDTQPCTHCGAPAVALDEGTVHFEIAATGAKSSWDDCYAGEIFRSKKTGTVAELAA